MYDFVSVPVPPDRVEEVYAVLAAPRPGTPAQESALDGWDDDSIRRFVQESSPLMRASVEYIAHRAGRPVTTNEIGNDLRLPKGAASVAGMFGAASRRSKNRYGRKLPWSTHWQYLPDGQGTETVLVMSEEIGRMVLNHIQA